MFSCVVATRLNKINEELLTVSTLQRMEKVIENGHNEKCLSVNELGNLSIPKQKSKAFVDKQIIIKGNESNIYGSNKKLIEKLKKELLQQQKCNEELQKNLDSLKEDIIKIKDEKEQQSSQLKELLVKLEDQKKLIEKANNFSADLIKQSDLMKSSKDDLLSQLSRSKKDVNDLLLQNNNLKNECEKWRSKIKTKEKKCAKLNKEILKLKEELTNIDEEKMKLEGKVTEFINVVQVCKEKESELENLRNSYQILSHQKECNLDKKEKELRDTVSKLEKMAEEYKSINKENERLKNNLDIKLKANFNLQKEIEKYKETLYCELKVKEKIINDKCDTIEKQKQLLKDSTFVVQQATEELESLKEQLQLEKETNRNLRIELEEINNDDLLRCNKCKILEVKIENLCLQKQKAIAAAKYAAEKLFFSTPKINEN